MVITVLDKAAVILFRRLPRLLLRLRLAIQLLVIQLVVMEPLLRGLPLPSTTPRPLQMQMQMQMPLVGLLLLR